MNLPIQFTSILFTIPIKHMPNYFQLFKKGSQKAETFINIDEAICKHFNIIPDKVKFHHGWDDHIGFRLAMGETFDQIIKECDNKQSKEPNHYWTHMKEIAIFLKENYKSTTWTIR